MSRRARITVLLIAVVVLTAVAGLYNLRAVLLAQQHDPAVPSGKLDLGQPGQIIFRNTQAGTGFGRVASVPIGHPAAERVVTGLSCDRVYAAAAAAVCLASRPGAVPRFTTTLVDRNLQETRTISPPGVPNRARLSSDGRMVAWTAFVTGHSYAKTGFSTRTSILDLNSEKFYADIETLQIHRDGGRLRASDLNLWGVTFAKDGKTFYASASTGGRTYLIEGDVATWEAKTLRENAECPSLSPDGTRLVFKKRVASDGARPWSLHVLDLSTMTEKPLPGSDGIDDQAVWLDDHTVMFAMNRDGGGTDVWAANADGTGAPRLLVPDASSPSVT
ncbi:MAG TPA: hypothetical protein DGT23_02550 [Micromonosporaceae bacterium]|nr:hypothetical protein [Micromonosporaceae bacterium]